MRLFRVRWARGLVVLVLASASCRSDHPKHGGARVHVLFDERHALEGGEAVRLHDFEVGEVASVDLAESRVRANLTIDRAVLAQLTRATTASVETDRGQRYLVLHVLDPDAERIREGATLEGVDSGLELTMRQAQTSASRLIERLGSPEWRKDASDLLSEMKGRIDEADLGTRKEEVRERLRDAQRELEKAADESASEAKKSLAAVRQELNRLASELEELGRSDEAKKLRERIDKLGKDDDGSGEK